jgi:DNA-binding transcriptional LysR family regulator
MLRITFRQLEAFYWAATLGTVAAAAKHLFVSQPAITARVKELEDILGLALLSRSQQGVQLTPAGRKLLQHAQHMLQLGEGLERGGRHEIPPLDGVLRIGADESSAAVGVSELVRQLRVRYPSMRVELSIERSKVLNEKLNRRELDVALQTSPAARPHVVDTFLGRVQVAWVASAAMELTHLPFAPGDATSIPVMMNPQSSVLHSVASDWLSMAGSDLHHLNTCNSLATIMKMAQEGHAIAALPVPVVLEQLKLGTLKLIEADPPLPAIAYYVSYLLEKQAAGVGTIVELAREVLNAAQFFVSRGDD